MECTQKDAGSPASLLPGKATITKTSTARLPIFYFFYILSAPSSRMFPEAQRDDVSVSLRAEPSDVTSQHLVQPRANALIQHRYKDRTKKTPSAN